ncbi:MAG: hypothetical protein KGI57_01535, partial [Hyphomicrobiales bacterium]|nr:hypothetical protein [Hyphomicrobiales bacterium]
MLDRPPHRPASGSAQVGAAIAHDSAEKHVRGAAAYVDDLPEPAGVVHLALGLSDRAHARLLAVDLGPVRAAP